MTMHNNITRQIFEGKYPYEMPYLSYLNLLEKGYSLLEQGISTHENLAELKAIRIALEYRFEVMRRVRSKQLKSLSGYTAALH